MSGVITVLAAVSATLLGGSAAGDRGFTVTERFAARAGPVLAGGELVWVREHGARRLSVRAGSGAASRTLLDVVGQSPRSSVGAWPSASASHVAVEVTDELPSGDRSGTLLAWSRSQVGGPLAGPLSTLGGPCTDAYLDPGLPRGLAVSGARVAFSGPGCDGRSVRDLAGGGEVALPAAAEKLRLDGDWVAWLERTDPGGNGYRAVARNLATGKEYGAPAAALPGLPRDFDVDEQGRLALLRPGSVAPRRGGLVLASPAEPAGRPIDLGRSRTVTRVRLAGGRVAVLAHDPRARNALIDGYVLAGDLDRGPLRRYGGGLDAADLVFGAFDFDGTRVAVRVRRCGRVVLVHAEGLGDLPRVHHPARCRVRLHGRPRVVDDRRLVFGFSCAGYVRDCEGERLRAVTAGRGPTTVARAAQALRPPRARLWLTRFGRRLARDGRLRRVRITARLGGFPLDVTRLHAVTAHVARRSQ